MWDVQENRQYDTKIKIDGVDYSENLIDLETSFDLDGSSVSSIFGSVLRDEIELEVFDNVTGKELDISFGYYTGDYQDEPQFEYKDFGTFNIYEVDYDEKMNTTKLKAETDLSTLDDEFVLQNLPTSEVGEELFISFKDFEIKDLKPNLIPNGWDSFQPYGSGKNYVGNWNFESGGTDWIRHGDATNTFSDNIVKIAKDNDGWGGIRQVVTFDESGQDFVYRVKARWIGGESPLSFRIQHGALWATGYFTFAKKNEWKTFEFTRKNADLGGPVYLYFRRDETVSEIEIDWIQITPVDNQHLVVEKIPLENGLTHIQTWGGNHWIKMMLNKGKAYDIDFTWSSFVRNQGAKDLLLIVNQGLMSDIIISKADKHITLTSNHMNPNYLQFRVGTRVDQKTDNLDFIASDPQIVEGDVSNPTMVITKLPDGREEVDIYGATDSTELVYKTEAVTGEPYELYGSIENKGRELQLDSTLGKSNIKKGDNQLNIKGEAQNREVAIKIGVA